MPESHRPEDEAIESVLSTAGERCFICGNVRFTLEVDHRDGAFQWQVYYKNHAPWHATLNLFIVAVSSDSLKVSAALNCPSGQLGHGVIHWYVPEECQREVHRCLIYGDVIYDKTVLGEWENQPRTGIPVIPLAKSFSESILPKDYSLKAFQGRAAALDVDFANGNWQLLMPQGAEEEKLPPFVQWLLLGALLVPISLLLWFLWNWFGSEIGGD